MFFAMPAIMTARRHALSYPHFQAGTDTLTRILSPTIFPGNTRNDTVGYRGIYRWPFPRSSSTWEATDAPWRHASEDSLTFITSTAARSNEQGHQSYQRARTPSSGWCANRDTTPMSALVLHQRSRSQAMHNPHAAAANRRARRPPQTRQVALSTRKPAGSQSAPRRHMTHTPQN